MVIFPVAFYYMYWESRRLGDRNGLKREVKEDRERQRERERERERENMKSAPLGLAGCQEWGLTTEALPVDGDCMTALIHYERQRWKKVNFFAKKLLPRSLFQHVQTLCMPSFIDLHTHATAGHVTSFACTKLQSLPIDRWHDRTTGSLRSTRSITIGWNMKHFRQTARGCLTAPVDLLACGMQ